MYQLKKYPNKIIIKTSITWYFVEKTRLNRTHIKKDKFYSYYLKIFLIWEVKNFMSFYPI